MKFTHAEYELGEEEVIQCFTCGCNVRGIALERENRIIHIRFFRNKHLHFLIECPKCYSTMLKEK